MFKVVSGGGSLSQVSVNTDKIGTATTDWQLGSDSYNQVLRASLYKPSGAYLTSRDLSVNCFRNDAWDAVSSAPDGNITGMVADTVYGVTFMVTVNSVYRQGYRYYIWEEVADLKQKSPRTIEIDGNGVIYVSTWSGEILKSLNHGESWITCTKPYPDHPYYIYMHISNDNNIWVFKFELPTKYSTDGGNTWLTAGSDLSSYGFGDVFRLKNGSLLFHGSNCCSLNRSDDNGQTWTHITTPGYSTKLYVNAKDEIFICNQDGGFTIFKSTDMGATFTRLYSALPQFGTTMDNIFNKWDNFYYILVPGYGILKSSDLNQYEVYWLNSEINNLFIDHTGVLIAKDWNYKTVYYRSNSN
ncbi:MAG TPA: sialidase family protein [Bacteroidales bacterium]|nr:sialidase family protein [Bacteroidales bacterium]